MQYSVFAGNNPVTLNPPPKKQIHISGTISFDDIKLKEISGAVSIGDDLWVVNDAGNSNSIYRIDKTSGKIVQEIKIINAANVDWEEMTISKTHLYIGDFGNNYGNRKNLRIYKISLADISSSATEVTAEIISFNYPDQTDFTKSANATDFDCEAMCFYNNELHLFTKKWETSGSTHYSVEVEEGYHVARKQNEIPVDFLVSGSCLSGNTLYLTGYDLHDFTVKIMSASFKENELYIDNTFTAGDLLTLGQVESIVLSSERGWLLSESTDMGFIHLPSRINSFALQNAASAD
ncbi:MAG: hypothetical protein ABI772_06515 [Bacteroidota bacterium]